MVRRMAGSRCFGAVRMGRIGTLGLWAGCRGGVEWVARAFFLVAGGRRVGVLCLHFGDWCRLVMSYPGRTVRRNRCWMACC
jgi:hypothetical protein